MTVTASSTMGRPRQRWPTQCLTARQPGLVSNALAPTLNCSLRLIRNAPSRRANALRQVLTDRLRDGSVALAGGRDAVLGANGSTPSLVPGRLIRRRIKSPSGIT